MVFRKKSSANQITGARAEKQACRFLRRQGLRLIDKNFRCRLGEIDLIMRDHDHIVFVEVRYRHSPHYGGSLATITHHKQRTLTHAAYYYLQQQRLHHTHPCRFDVVAMGPAQQIHWIKDAFQVK